MEEVSSQLGLWDTHDTKLNGMAKFEQDMM